MNKDKYLEIRKLEKKENDCYITINKIDKFLERNKEYIDDFENEAKEAIKRLKEYRELLRYRADCFSKVVQSEFINQKNGCKHEIVFFDSREGFENDIFSYYCPLCRSYVNASDIKDDMLIIGVPNNEVREDSPLYKIVDYLLESGNYTQEEFDNALKKFALGYKDNVKVVVKK